MTRPEDNIHWGSRFRTMTRLQRGLLTRTVLTLVVMCGLAAYGSCSRKPEEIRIGVIATTRVPIMIESMLNSVEMARSELEKEEGLLVNGRHHPVRFLVERIEGGVPEQAVTAIARLINQKNVCAVIGPDFSIDAIPAGEIAEKARVPLISPLSTHPLTTKGKRYVFRMPFTNNFQARVSAEFCARELMAHKFSVLYNRANPYSRDLAETFRDSVEREGGQVAAYESYTTGEEDFSRQIIKIKESGSDFLYLPNFWYETEPFVIKARAAGIKTTLMGVESWNRQILKKIPEFDGSFMTAHWAIDAPGGKGRVFYDQYTSLFDILPEDGAALTYDAIHLLLTAIQTRGSMESEAIRDGLYALGAFQGVSGKMEYVDSGDPERELLILKFEDGTVRYVRKYLPEAHNPG